MEEQDEENCEEATSQIQREGYSARQLTWPLQKPVSWKRDCPIFKENQEMSQQDIMSSSGLDTNLDKPVVKNIF